MHVSLYVCASVYRCICTCFLCVDKRSLIKKNIILIRVHLECFLSLRDSVC